MRRIHRINSGDKLYIWQEDTALRDINELLERDVLMRSEASGRSTSYEIQSPTVDVFGSIKQGLNQAIAHAKNQ
jgi:hypothetical protein